MIINNKNLDKKAYKTDSNNKFNKPNKTNSKQKQNKKVYKVSNNQKLGKRSGTKSNENYLRKKHTK